MALPRLGRQSSHGGSIQGADVDPLSSIRQQRQGFGALLRAHCGQGQQTGGAGMPCQIVQKSDSGRPGVVQVVEDQ